MTENLQARTIVRFGTFELDLRAGELRKGGIRIRVQEQPFRLLAMLVESPGEVITREELRDRLWPADTYVDFDNSLNTAASKLRDALGDSASNPRFIETLPRRGYRFLAPVQTVGNGGMGGNATSYPEEPNRDALAPDAAGWRRMAWPAVCALLMGVVAWHWFGASSERPDAPLRRFALQPPAAFDWPVISPDGLHLAYIASEGLWVQDFDQDEPRRIVANGVRREPPAWSPDSREIAYSTGRELRRIAATGGASSLVYDFGKEFFLSGTAAWSPDGQWIYFAGQYWQDPSLPSGAIHRVSVKGGKPDLLPGGGPGGRLFRYSDVRFVPRGPKEWVLLASRDAPDTPPQVIVRSGDTGEDVVLTEGVQPSYSPTGHVIYTTGADRDLQAVPFSAASLEVEGEAFMVRENACFASVSTNGLFAYIDNGKALGKQLGWRDRHGNRLGVVGQPQSGIRYPEISLDGRRVAVAGVENGREQIWIHDLDRPVKTQSTFQTAQLNRGPLWLSPQQILFTSFQESLSALYVGRVDGGEATELRASEGGFAFASDASADGCSILFDKYDENQPSDIWRLSRSGGRVTETEPFLATEFEEKAGRFSPDKRWVAYVSDESGQYDVYVCRFPEGDKKRKVSETGGTGPRWSGDGRKLYYVQQTLLVESEILRGGESGDPTVGDTTPLFREPELAARGSAYPQYDVSPDGERFLIRQRASDYTIRVVENWYEEFRNQEED